LSGATEYDIREAMAAAYPDDDPLPLLLGAMAAIRRAANCDHDLIKGFALEATRDLYNRMLQIGDFTGALRAVRQLVDLAQ
jgi:hypothetical protein